MGPVGTYIADQTVTLLFLIGGEEDVRPKGRSTSGLLGTDVPVVPSSLGLWSRSTGAPRFVREGLYGP